MGRLGTGLLHIGAATLLTLGPASVRHARADESSAHIAANALVDAAEAPELPPMMVIVDPVVDETRASVEAVRGWNETLRDCVDASELFRAGPPARKRLGARVRASGTGCVVSLSIFDDRIGVVDQALSQRAKCDPTSIRRALTQIFSELSPRLPAAPKRRSRTRAPPATQISHDGKRAPRVVGEVYGLSIGYGSTLDGFAGLAMNTDLLTYRYSPFYVTVFSVGMLIAERGPDAGAPGQAASEQFAIHFGPHFGASFVFGDERAHEVRAGGGIVGFSSERSGGSAPSGTDGLVPAIVGSARYLWHPAPSLEGLGLGAGLRTVIPLDVAEGQPQIFAGELILTMGFGL